MIVKKADKKHGATTVREKQRTELGKPSIIPGIQILQIAFNCKGYALRLI